MSDYDRITAILNVRPDYWQPNDLFVDGELVGREAVTKNGILTFDVYGELVEAWSVLG